MGHVEKYKCMCACAWSGDTQIMQLRTIGHGDRDKPTAKWHETVLKSIDDGARDPYRAAETTILPDGTTVTQLLVATYDPRSGGKGVTIGHVRDA